MLRPFAADDAALHVIAGQVHHADDGLGRLLAGHALDGLDDDLAGLGGALGARLVLDGAHEHGCLAARVRLDAGHQLGLRLLGGQAGDALEFAVELADPRVEGGGAGRRVRPRGWRRSASSASRSRWPRIRARRWTCRARPVRTAGDVRRPRGGFRVRPARRSRSPSSVPRRRASSVRRAISCCAAVRASARMSPASASARVRVAWASRVADCASARAARRVASASASAAWRSASVSACTWARCATASEP